MAHTEFGSKKSLVRGLNFCSKSYLSYYDWEDQAPEIFCHINNRCGSGSTAN